MGQKTYLLLFDILGFEKLGKEIASKKGMEPRVVREHFLNVLRDRVKALEAKGLITGKHYGESDDWLLALDSPDKVLKVIGGILDHHTGYDNYQTIPLEFAVDVAEFDKWARFSEGKLIAEDATIKVLKEYFFYRYHEWHKKHNKGQSIKSTYVITTESAQRELAPLGLKNDNPIEHGGIRFFVAAADRVQQRGRVFEFLDKIGRPGSRLYDSIDNLYVPPLEYPEIVKTLKEKRLVFITGTLEYGKTYTAIRLMWDYYERGYAPGWHEGQEKEQRDRVRGKLAEIRAELKPKHIIYFEDPFGQTRYEKRESLEREIATIVECVEQVDDCYVIITSREEVFKEFEREVVSPRALQEFERKLNIQKPSYDYEARKAMAVRWAEKWDCKWLRNSELENLVLQSLRDEKLLPTPLSIRDFALTTVNIEKEPELREKIREKSVEVEKAFAKEIDNMADDKIIFLLLPFIGTFDVQFTRQEYQHFVAGLGLKDAWQFDRILDWFRDDKVIVTYRAIEFSHPSYSKAMEHLLGGEGYTLNTIRQTFAKLLLQLAEKDYAAWGVARAIAENFDVLPENVRGLLFKFAERDNAAQCVAGVMVRNFDKLPESVRNELLLRLVENDIAAGNVAWAIANNFDKLPEAVRNELLLRLAEKDDATGFVAWAIALNFNKLPENGRGLLFKLAGNDIAAGGVAWAIELNFDKLPADVRNELLLRLAEKDKAAVFVARAIATNFDKVPADVRGLLFNLADKDSAAGDVALAIAYNFAEVPEAVRNELLLRLAEKDKAAVFVARAIANNFAELPEAVRGLLFKLAEMDSVAGDVALTIAYKFAELPEAVRGLLFKLSEKDDAAGDVARAIAIHFDKLPEEVRNELLLKLVERNNANVTEALKVVTDRHFGKLPQQVIDRIQKLAGNLDTTQGLNN